jgi:tetratricopeptide (TPR) repeat protein
MRTSATNSFISLLLAASVLGCFYPVLRHEFVNFDDPSYVIDNPHVTTGLSTANLRWAWTSSYFSIWHPLTWISYMFDHEIHGLNPRGFHATNLALHIANAVLLFLWLVRVTNSTWPSALAAGLFALHPLQVEPVAWVSSRKDVLSTLLLILALWAYAAYVRQPKWHRYLAVLVLFVLGLSAKSMLVTLPVLMLVLDYWPFQRVDRATWRRLVWEKLPLLALSLLVSVLTYAIMRGAGGVTSARSNSLADQVTNVALGYGEYLAKALWPVRLAPFYPRSDAPAELAPRLAAIAVLVAISTVALYLTRRLPALIVGWLWFLVSLVPVIGIVQIGGHRMADRYAYVPSIGLSIVLAWCAAEIVARFRVPRAAAGACFVTLLAVLGIASWFQVRHWRNSVTLFEHTLKVTRGNYLAHANLGSARFDQGNLSEAEDHFKASLRADPEYAPAHIGMGNVRMKQGASHEAAVHYNRALQSRPNDIEIQLALAESLLAIGNWEAAAVQLNRVLQLRPYHPEAHGLLGLALSIGERRQEAVGHFATALRAKPGWAEMHNNLGVTLSGLGRHEDAARAFRQAIALKPDVEFGFFNLGCALYAAGQRADAIATYRDGLERDPHSPQLATSLAWSLATDEDDGLRDGPEALRLALVAAESTRYENPEVLDVLAAAYAESGRFEEAIKIETHALALAGAASQTRAAQDYAKRLELYRAGLPFRSIRLPEVP